MMSEVQALAKAQTELERLIGNPGNTLAFRSRSHDYVLQIGAWTFLLEAKTSASTAVVANATRHLLARHDPRATKTIPLLVVPYMGPTGQKICREAGVSWLDLAGNADIRARDLVVHVQGRLNPSNPLGRSSNPFAPKSSRVTRVLLADPTTPVLHRDLVQRTQLGRGFVTRIVQRLEHEGYLDRDAETATTKVRDPGLLLEEWRSRYRFDKHDIRRAHFAVAGDEDLMAVLDRGLAKLDLRYAATGLGAAWLLASFTGFRIATFFLDRPLTDSEAKAMSLKWTDRGANVWIVVPNDEGVFYGAEPRAGPIPCVHPVQAYIDLAGHPERSDEAAETLKQRYLMWPRK